MKKWSVLLAFAWGTDIALRLQAHAGPVQPPAATFWPGLQLVAVPGAGLRLAGLGVASSAAVLLSLALLAAGGYLLTQALLDLPRQRLFRAGLLSALGAVAWTGLDVAEALVFGERLAPLAWRPGDGVAAVFGPGDLVLPLLLATLALCWAGLLARGLFRDG